MTWILLHIPEDQETKDFWEQEINSLSNDIEDLKISGEWNDSMIDQAAQKIRKDIDFKDVFDIVKEFLPDKMQEAV